MFILTPEQDARMRQGVQGFPETFNPPRRYPALRPNRNRRGQDQVPDPNDPTNAALPLDFQGRQGTPHLWPFLVSLAVVGRSTAVSPRYSGPALIDYMVGQINIAGNVASPGWQILIADDDAGRGSGLSTARPSGDPIFDVYDSEGVGVTPSIDAQTFPAPNSIGTVFSGQISLGYRTRRPSFFVKVSLLSQAAAGSYIEGYLRIVENLQDYVETA